jgi:adenylosuccinate synthase
MGEFVDPGIFRQRLSDVLSVKNRLLAMMGGSPIEFGSLHEEYSRFADRLRPFVVDTECMVAEAVEDDKRVLFEGAQGTFLDLDSGTYPYVTSSHPVAGGACLGTGVGPRAIQNVLGVCKAYTTRVGSGPFPSELENEIGEFIRDAGQEYGTVTGRGRRCGWLDLVALRHSCRLNSLSGLVVTRLDVLSGIEKVKVATEYTLDGKVIPSMPMNTWEFARVSPTFKEYDGWSGDLKRCRTLAELPDTTRAYLKAIEDFTKTPIAIVSIGPDRDETIIVRPDLIWG